MVITFENKSIDVLPRFLSFPGGVSISSKAFVHRNYH